MKHLGRDKHRRAVFALIYGRGAKLRSKRQIAEALGMSGDAQVIQNALEHLARYNLIVKMPNEGQVRDGSRFIYGKEESVRAHRAPILKFADDPNAANKIVTKRRPLAETGLSFVKTPSHPIVSRRTTSAKRKAATLKIALLVTNPDRDASLQTLVETRLIRAALASVEKRDLIDVETVPAPTFDSLLDTLNDYRPTVLHFSGNGGARTLTFDNERAGDNGGTVLDFDMIARVIAATSAKPALLVLMACDTVDGADRFLSEVPAVIAMAAAVEDEAAIEFSRRFYRSLGSGSSIAQSLEQTKLFLEQNGYRDANLPTLLTREEADGLRTLL